MKIAITGASGQLGHLVIEALLKTVPANQIIALVRNIEKSQDLQDKGLELRAFDYNQPDTLAASLEGVERLLLISGNEIGRRTEQHQAVVNAAEQAGVKFIAYTSLLRADTNPLALAKEYQETEALIKASQLDYTILRNNWYHENYLANVQQVAELGTLFGAAKDGKISSASRQDYAEAAAQVLTTQGHENRTYELAGSTAFTLTDLATHIGNASGKTVKYQNLTAEEYRDLLTQVGLPADLIGVLVEADIQTIDGVMYSDRTDLETLIGHKPITMQQLVQKLFK